jgi:hypothetical protein
MLLSWDEEKINVDFLDLWTCESMHSMSFNAVRAHFSLFLGLRNRFPIPNEDDSSTRFAFIASQLDLSLLF